MSWIGLRDRKGCAFSTSGLGVVATERVDPNTVLRQGSLIMEFAAIPGDGDQRLFRFESPSVGGLRLEVRLDLDGSLTLSQSQTGSAFNHKIPAGFVTRSNSITMRYTWDADAGVAGLSMEIMETSELHFIALSGFGTVTLRDAIQMFIGRHAAQIATGVGFIALADHAMPHGDLPNLAPETRIMTPHGKRSADSLRTGDLVVDCDGKEAQIRWIGTYEMPAVGRFAPLQICAPFHKARRDLICTRDQLIRLSGSEVEYLFATDHVAAKVGHLQHGVARVPTARHSLIRNLGFVLDRPAVLDVSGVKIEGMDVAAINGCNGLKNFSILSDLPETIWPASTDQYCQRLKPFETKAWSTLQAA